jgi:hypothetical protein
MQIEFLGYFKFDDKYNVNVILIIKLTVKSIVDL